MDVTDSDYEDSVCLSRTKLEKIAFLVKIKLSSVEIDYYLKELKVVLTWMNAISRVDTNGVDPMIHGGLSVNSRCRDDIVIDEEIRDQVLSRAPFSERGYFVVPKAVDHDV